MPKKILFFITVLFAYVNVLAQSNIDEYSEALNYYNSNQFSSAYKIFKKLSSESDLEILKRSSSKYYTAKCLLNLNELNGSAAEYESFIDTYPFSLLVEDALYELGTIYYKNKEFRKCRDKLKILLNDYPQNVYNGTAYYWIGESHIAENKFIDAEENLKEAISRRETNKYIDYSIYSLALLYENTKDYNNAVAHYDELLSFYKSSSLAPKAQLRIGICYFNLKDYDNAVLELTDPILKNLNAEDRFESKYYLANSFSRLKDYKNATAIYEELLLDNLESSKSNIIKYSLAWTKFQTSNYNEAYNIFNQLSQSGSDTLSINALYWSAECKRYLGDSKTADDLYKLFIEKYPNHPFASKAQLGKGSVYFSTNQSKEAESALLIAASSNDNLTRGRAYTILGEMNLNKKEFEQAKKYFENARAFTKNDHKIYNRAVLGLGVAQFYLNNFNEAIKELQFLFDNFSEMESDKVNFYLAESFFMRKEFNAALKHYNYISTDNNLIKQQTLYGKAYSYFNMKDFSNSVYYFNEFISKYRNDSKTNDAKLRLADSYYGIKNFDKASQIYRELFKFNKELLDNDHAYYQYCQALFKAGQSSEAISEFVALQQKFPRSQYADASQYVVGWIYFQQNNFNEAISNYKKLVSKYPNSSLIPTAYYSIGDSYFNTANYDSSITFYNKIIVLYPNTTYILDAVNGIQYAYVAKDEPELAINFIDNYVNRNPSSKFSDQIYFKKGDIFYSIEEYQKAIDAYYDFILRYPSSIWIPNAYYWLGKSAANLKLETQAIENFERVIEKSLKSDIGISAAVELSKIYSNKKLYSFAINVLNSVINAQPTSNRIPELLFIRGTAETSDGRHQEAYSTFDQVITYYEGSVFSAKSKIELAILEINRKNYDNALIPLRELAEKRLDDIGAQAQYLIGELFFSQNNYQEAITSFVRVRSVYSTFDEWYTKSLLRLGDCYVKLNDKRHAREMYRAVINRHKTSDLAKEATRKLNQL